MNKEELYLKIKHDIVKHILKPGQPLVESDYSANFGISRTPVREVFRRLESENLVSIIPHKGTYVKILTSKDVEEIVDLRIQLESFAAYKAAEKITEEDLRRLNEIKNLILDATELKIDENNGNNPFLSANTQLHHFILNKCGNSRIISIIESIQSQIAWFIHITRGTKGRMKSSAREHLKIIKALINRNPREAQKRMTEHLSTTKDILLNSDYFLSQKNMEYDFDLILKRY